MMVLVSYDVGTTSDGGPRRLRRIAKMCQNYGQRVQYSVFELEVEPARWVGIKQQLCNLIDPDVDSLRFYFMGSSWREKVAHIGAKPVLDLNGPLVL